MADAKVIPFDDDRSRAERRAAAAAAPGRGEPAQGPRNPRWSERSSPCPAGRLRSMMFP